MPLPPDRRLQLRVLGALALVVAVNGVVLAALAWIGSRALAVSGRSVSIELGLPLSVGAVLLGAIGLVATQARYGSRTAVSGLELAEVDGNGPRNVASRLRRPAVQADVPVPSVAVADRPEPGCLTVGPQRSPMIVLTTACSRNSTTTNSRPRWPTRSPTSPTVTSRSPPPSPRPSRSATGCSSASDCSGAFSRTRRRSPSSPGSALSSLQSRSSCSACATSS